MRKRTKIILVASAIVVVLVPVAGIATYVLLRKSKNQTLNPIRTSLSVAVSPQIAQDQKTKYLDVVKRQLEADGFETREGDIQSADIVISTTTGGESQPIETSMVGQPSKLEASEVVSPQSKDTVFVSYKNLPSSFSDQQQLVLADELKKLQAPDITWSLNAVGDVIIGRTVYEQESKLGDYTSSFSKVKDLVQNADYTVADAEWTAADGVPYPLQGLSFASPAKSLDGLTFSGIDAVSLANNHSMNGGVAAFEQMFSNLKARNIGYFGAGHNFTDAHTPYIANVKGVKVAFLGYTAIPGDVEAGSNNTGVAFMKITPWFPFTESYVAQMEADIKAAKTQADVVIPFFHWSEEYTHQPSDEMRTVAHRAIDAGATMVIGSHPHWVQGIEWYNGHLINYSLGNFVFDQEQSLKTKQGVMLSTQFSGPNLVEAKYTPIQIEQYYQPHVLEGAAGQEVLNNMYTHSWWVQ